MPRMSLARQLLILQVVAVAIAVGLAGFFAIRAGREQVRDQQRERALSMAQTLAASGQVRDALRTDRPQDVLQPLAERIRRRTGVGFVVVMSPAGKRYSHPNPQELGKTYIGEIAAAQRGGVVVEHRTGTLGPSVRAVVPVRDGAAITGLVAVGVLDEAISAQVRDQLPGLLGALGLALAVGLTLSALLARRVRRQTRGMDPATLGALYEHHAAVLHAIREGIAVVGADGTLRLLNGEAQRLLGLTDADVGRPVAELVDDPALRDVLLGRSDSDVHVVGGRVLVSGRSTAQVAGQGEAFVTTLRDRTELEGMVRELATVRGMAEALRAQAHESANELHTVVGLVELGRYEDAITFATRRIRVTQDEVEHVQQRIGEPVLVALLLAKSAACRERGVHLVLADDAALPEGALDAEDAVTVVGNLVDNALDALGDQRGGRIEVYLGRDGEQVVIRVRDDGPGLPPDALTSAFEPGWTTKDSDEGPGRRGVGLALVAATAERLHGSAVARNDGGAVIEVRVSARDTAGTPR